ncbi:MAG: RDD family protein [Trichodesmium sp. St16_bin4-tuft]|nr:RDD family protein [Trichodesmium sp. St5_bin8]MDE5099862.1 RDD family protein [Trichodesmium sp. St16_bin4-tuft]MDE5105428.1 RDD family protein [Trichodesmium sp. St19_bin2]
MLSWLYHAIMESSGKQGTLGKIAVRLVVTDKRGKRLTFCRSAYRHFAKSLFATMMIGCIIAEFTKKKQALHDMIAGTIVYQRRPSK